MPKWNDVPATPALSAVAMGLPGARGRGVPSLIGQRPLVLHAAISMHRHMFSRQPLHLLCPSLFQAVKSSGSTSSSLSCRKEQRRQPHLCVICAQGSSQLQSSACVGQPHG